jgi:metal-sulfur cluster biosynthetic enzyme
MSPKDKAIEVLKNIVDPELYIDIWTLGLIYDVSFEGDQLTVQMTFTSMACPAGPMLVQEVKDRTEELEEVSHTNVKVVFDPPWEPSEELKGMMGLL